MVLTTSNTAESTHNQLKTKHHGVLISKSWISRTLTSERLTVEQIYKKWLTTDIVETEGDCLPPNITSVTAGKLEIPGPLTLQVQSVLNVGSSFYSQLKKMNGKAIPEPTQQTQFNEPPPSRMLFITLTDGTNVVNGMEYKPCPQLSVNILPGTKILVSNVVARIGVLLLQPGNFKVLGGCVERLRSLNAQDKVLKKALEGEEEGEEEEDDGDDVIVVSDQTENSTSAPGFNINKSNMSSAITHGNNNNKIKHRVIDNPCTSSVTFTTATKSVVKQTVFQAAPAAFPNHPPSAKSCVKSDTSPSHKHSHFQNDQSSSTSHSNKRVKSELSTNSNPREVDCNLGNDLEELFEPDEDFEMSVETHQNTNSVPEQPNSSIPINSLSTNLSFPLKITATISSLASKLLPVPEWTAQALLTDRSGTKELRLSEKFLCKLIGFTSAEFKQLKPVSATNQAIRTFLRSGLESCQNELVFKTGQFEVQLNTVTSELSPFEIVEFESVDEASENELREYVRGRVEG